MVDHPLLHISILNCILQWEGKHKILSARDSYQSRPGCPDCLMPNRWPFASVTGHLVFGTFAVQILDFKAMYYRGQLPHHLGDGQLLFFREIYLDAFQHNIQRVAEMDEMAAIYYMVFYSVKKSFRRGSVRSRLVQSACSGILAPAGLP